ncbi:uncharacterized protein B0J16DRAFT_67562 [Fusarium flagelliforme]|uniref:Bacteriophage T5 Orf172 DNA-binding domain-containing protein n=1 Tax=Fusarium flagelliforme TaxID=2675880 RepID=A0A395MI39_9HYPO|nr:uncharacterized protein B0J16DRAFT_67562 [Fusarium flagelliforme]KAH7192952.1 hypothetical protein B0J16DRAFT_67562 [Fusarium flagelliforme]RFN47440.1 hypothetical protein FIE12Z_8302 [Fusarium flagelliforme]
MATSQVSEHPLFTGLRELIVFFPKPEDEHDFKFCRWQKDDSTRCRNPRADIARDEAKRLWSEIEQKKECLDISFFYPKVERLLQITHCHVHKPQVLKSFEEWKDRHCASTALADTPAETSQSLSQESSRALKDDPDEASEPETPETPETEIFDPSVCSDTSPFPTPLTEPDSIRTPIKLPASILDRSIPDTQPDIVNHVPMSTTDKEKFAVNAITKDISTLSLGSTLPTPNKSSAGGKTAIAESISEDDDASFQGMPGELSIITDGKSVIDQATTGVSTWEGKAPKVEDDPLGHQIAIEGIGIARLSRKGTLHHVSPIIKALNTPPTPGKQRRHGIVYILRSTSNKEIFKIGWTEKSAEERHHQPNNCYAKNTEIIYESRKPFAGAYKAELLAQKFLGSCNLPIIECESCGKGHREWFKGEETVIRGTLEAMEDFLQMPAYELKAGEENDGEMTLSQEAKKRVKSMCNISIEGLRGSTIGQKEPASLQDDVLGESIGVNSQTATQTTAPQVTADIPVQTTEVESPQKSETSAGQKIGRLVGNIGKGFGKFKDTVQNMRSRESTPDPDGFQQVPKDAGAFENFTTNILWALKGGKPEALKENGSLWDSLVQAAVDKKESFKEDFAKGRREVDGRS